MEMFSEILWHVALRNTLSCICKIFFTGVKNCEIAKFYIFIFFKQFVYIANDLSHSIRFDARQGFVFCSRLLTA